MQKHNCGGLKYLGLVALLVAAFLGLPNRASADFKLYAQQDAGAIIEIGSTATDFGSIVLVGATFGDFAIDVLVTTSDNNAAMSDLVKTTTKVTNTDTDPHTLTLYAVQTNYTLPAGSPLLVRSGLSGGNLKGAVGLTGIFQAYADEDNDLVPPSGLDDFTNGPQDAVLAPSGGTFDTGTASGLFDRSGDYSLTSRANLSVSGGGEVQFTSSITVTATPEPGSLVLCGLGAGLVGFYGWRRRGLNPQPAIA